MLSGEIEIRIHQRYLDLSLVETINFNTGKAYGDLTLAHEYSI